MPLEKTMNICAIKPAKLCLVCTKKPSKMGKIPPGIMLHMFDAMIKPILVYGSDAWGTNKAAHLTVHKVFLHFARCILCLKATTSNAIVFGQTGHLPPSLSCMISALTFANRLYHMSSDKMAKGVFIELNRLHEQGFTTWMTKVLDLANDYNLYIKQNRHSFKYECKMVVIDRFISNWHNNLINTEINPGLRTYQTTRNPLDRSLIST